MELTASNVDGVFMDSLFRDEEIADGPPEMFVKAEGITMTVGFHPERLRSHEEDVRSMLGQLPEKFAENGGGGASFLEGYLRRDGQQWGDHPDMEKLFLLAMASGLGSCPMPREVWSALPGGMPYFIVVTEEATRRAILQARAQA